MWLFGRAAPERITKQLAEIEEFPMSPTVDQPGWTRPHYALRDRQVFSPGTSIDTVTAVFAAAPSTPATAGTLKNWRRRVAFRLTGQALPSFMMALPFVGPLLDVIGRQQSVIFELIGAAGTGKTSLQKIAAGTPERFEDLLTGGHDYLARYAGSLSHPVAWRHKYEMSSPICRAFLNRSSASSRRELRSSTMLVLNRRLARLSRTGSLACVSATGYSASSTAFRTTRPALANSRTPCAPPPRHRKARPFRHIFSD
jgi:hypothetical protein